jgi:PHD/YefM family antitoxin component YafN of YafNO toxin-antitoxin module
MGDGLVYTLGMKLTYNIREVQANLSKLCRTNQKFVIANRDKPVLVALPIEEYEAMLETLDVLSDEKAMAAIRKARAGETTYVELDLEDENFGIR